MWTRVTLIRVGVLVGGLLILGPARAPLPSDPPVTIPLARPAASPEPAESSSLPPPVLAARALLGVPVTTADGVRLGQLDDVLIDPTEGRIILVIVSAGGWLGFGGRFVALPWAMLRPTANGMGVVVTESHPATSPRTLRRRKSCLPRNPGPQPLNDKGGAVCTSISC